MQMKQYATMTGAERLTEARYILSAADTDTVASALVDRTEEVMGWARAHFTGKPAIVALAEKVAALSLDTFADPDLAAIMDAMTRCMAFWGGRKPSANVEEHRARRRADGTFREGRRA